MKRPILFIFLWIAIGTMGQQSDSTSSSYLNSAGQMLESNAKLSIGGYGEVHYNQPLAKNRFSAGTLDVHRLVLFVGYNFSKNTRFVSEIEFEYAKDLWVEQAFLQQKLARNVFLRAGLMLVPMGIINEYHEPATFNGVERPVIDNKLSLSTWREIGIGVAGSWMALSLRYQAYIMGGLNGYDTKGVFSADKGLREGRQKGSKAYVTSPNFSGKIEYFGVRNLNIGLSGYLGKSQSKLFSNLSKDSTRQILEADSSVVGIAMTGVDFRYSRKGFEARGQFYYTWISNTEQYNVFTATADKNNNLGSGMTGYYAEAGYDILRLLAKTELELVPFIRYEYYDMQHTVAVPVTKNNFYANTVITTGLTFRLNRHAVFKTDIQFDKSKAADSWSKTLNAGIGVMF